MKVFRVWWTERYDRMIEFEAENLDAAKQKAVELAESADGLVSENSDDGGEFLSFDGTVDVYEEKPDETGFANFGDEPDASIPWES